MKLALRYDAEINSCNFRGNTALRLCYKYGSSTTLGAYLIRKVADGSIRNKDGQTCQDYERICLRCSKPECHEIKNTNAYIQITVDINILIETSFNITLTQLINSNVIRFNFKQECSTSSLISMSPLSYHFGRRHTIYDQTFHLPPSPVE